MASAVREIGHVGGGRTPSPTTLPGPNTVTLSAVNGGTSAFPAASRPGELILSFNLNSIQIRVYVDYSLIYLTVARHRHNATVVTSNRTPDEWLGLMHDQLLAQSAVDRLTSTCHELVIEGDSYRKRQRPSPGFGA